MIRSIDDKATKYNNFRVTITTLRFDRLIYAGSLEFFYAALRDLYGSLICQSPRKIVCRGNEGHMGETLDGISKRLA